MGVFEQFPYSNFHDLNLDWILNEIKNQAANIETLQETDQSLADSIEAVENGIPTVVQTFLDEQGIGPLPEVSVSDNGDVLAVVNGKWAKATAPGATLPIVTAQDNGKVLGVVNGEWTKTYTGQIQPDEFPELPYPIVADAFGQYKIGIDLLAYKISTLATYEEIWVDSVNGVDRSGASTEEQPFKSLKQAYVRAGNRNAIIHVTPESLFWDDDLPGYNINVKQYTWITEGNGATAIWGIKEPGWSAYLAVPGAYYCDTTTAKKCNAIVDLSDNNKDKFGFARGYTKVADQSDLVEGTYFIAPGNHDIYVYPRTGSDINSIHPLRSDYGLRFGMITATGASCFYMKDLNYIGSMYTASRGSGQTDSTSPREWIFENCTFSHSAAGDTFGQNSADIVYLIDCKGAYALHDIFNGHCSTSYMTTEQIGNSVYVNLNCQALEAGWYDADSGNTDNLYTAHDGMNVLRVNCRGYNARGPMLADVNGCRSVNVFVNLYNNSYALSTIAACITFNNEQNWRSGLATLINVFAGDNVHANLPKLLASTDVEMLGGNLYADLVTTDDYIITPVQIKI